MAIGLTATHQQHFDEHGWTVVRQVLPPARVATLLAALDTMIPESAYARGWVGRVVEVPAISRGSAELLSHARDPALAKLGAAVLGARRLRLLQDTALVKPGAGGGRVEWHQDYSYFAFLDEPRVVTLRLALTACTRDNGCLRAIRGSHRWGLQGERSVVSRAHRRRCAGGVTGAAAGGGAERRKNWSSSSRGTSAFTTA